jgi:hypothetical protein
MSTVSYVVEGGRRSSTIVPGALMLAMALFVTGLIVVAVSWALTDPAAVLQTFDGFIAP